MVRIALSRGRAAGQSMNLGCLTLFMLPFFACGLGAIIIGIREVLRGNTEGWALIFFGLVFGGFAAGFYALARRGARVQAEQSARRAQFANEPWKIRDDWASGRITTAGQRGVAVVWFFAIFWNVVSWPVVFAFPKEWAKGNHAILIGLLFPLVGLGLLAWAIRATLQHHKYGDAILELQTIPGAIGGVLAGTLRLRQPLVTRDGVRLRLSCINRVVTGSGKNRSTHEHIRWQEDQRIRKDRDLPVFFRIPEDVQPSNSSNPHNTLLWRLEATAATPGVDFSAQFEVPVFRVSQAPIAEAAAVARFREESSAYQPPPRSRIRFNRYAAGGPEFYFPPARNLGAIIGLGIFTAIWTAAIWFMINHGAPILFPIVFGFFELLLLLWLGSMLIWSSRVIISPQGIRLHRGITGLHSTRIVGRDEIAEIQLATGMQAGNRLYHDIKLHLTNGKSLTLGSNLGDKREAQWLLDQMCDCLSGRG